MKNSFARALIFWLGVLLTVCVGCASPGTPYYDCVQRTVNGIGQAERETHFISSLPDGGTLKARWVKAESVKK